MTEIVGWHNATRQGTRSVRPAEITKIWVFKCEKSKSTTMEHVYNESANFIEGHAVHFDINGP